MSDYVSPFEIADELEELLMEVSDFSSTISQHMRDVEECAGEQIDFPMYSSDFRLLQKQLAYIVSRLEEVEQHSGNLMEGAQ